MALSAEAYQEVEIATCLLSGCTALGSRISRVLLAFFFGARFGILAFGARSVWLDEQADFICNSSKPLCKPSCFDEFCPISSFNLFALQLMVLFAHGMGMAGFSRSGYQQREGWLQTQLRKKNIQMKLHIIGLTTRMLIEVLFLLTFYKETEGFVHRRTTWCRTPLCEPFVFCTDINSTVRNIFSLGLCSASAVSVTICFWELLSCLPSMQRGPLISPAFGKKQDR